MDRQSWTSPEDQSINRANATRQRAADRSTRIHDPRSRRIGLDIDAIQQQIEEKKELAAREKARNDAFDHMTLQQQDLVLAAQEHYNEQVHQMDVERENFRKNYQRPEQSREYDIWRKDYLKVQEPIRNGDDDPRLGVSCGQIFDGEDLKKGERMAMQAKQRKEWYNEQMREKQMKKAREQAEDLRDQLYVLETQKQINDLTKQQEEQKAAIRKQLAEDNLRLFQEKKAREEADRQFTQKYDDAQKRVNLRSRTIVEEMCPRTAGPMEYRGMTIEEQQEIIRQQKKQMEDNERRRQEEAERERQWEEYQAYLRAEGDKNEVEYLRKRQQMVKELADFQKKQDEEFKARQRFLNKEVYGKNIPDDSYYDQWGNSTR